MKDQVYLKLTQHCKLNTVYSNKNFFKRLRIKDSVCTSGSKQCSYREEQVSGSESAQFEAGIRKL